MEVWAVKESQVLTVQNSNVMTKKSIISDMKDNNYMQSIENSMISYIMKKLT